MRAPQKKRLYQELEKRVNAILSKENPSKEEYLNLDLALRISGVISGIDVLWVKLNYVGYKNGWLAEAQSIINKILNKRDFNL